MCGRFAFYSPTEAVAALFRFEPAFPVEPRYNIAPTQMIATVRISELRQPELVMLRWGLVPSWAKDPAIGNRMINARVETLADKPAFRDAYRKRRCIVLADGFYEWRGEAHGKTPYFISLENGEPFAFAGLWDRWVDKSSGESVQSATIVTTSANDFLATLHHRMPVVLLPDSATAWLSGEPNVLEAAAARPLPFQAWPVDRSVNNARNEGPQLVEPVNVNRPSAG